MRKLRLLILVLGALWLFGELAIVPLAEGQIEQRVAERNQGVSSVQADVGSFPVATRLALTGKVNSVTVVLDRVARRAVTFAQVRFDLDGVEIDRGGILRGEGRVTAIDRGTVTATIDALALGPVLGRAIELSGVRVDGRVLRIGPASVQLDAQLFPCVPNARVEGDRVVLTCSIDEVPPALVEAAQR